MKNLKMLQSVFMILVISIFVGCSDQLTSPGDLQMNEPLKKDRKEVVPTVAESFSLDTYFRLQIRLKPHRFYKFDVLNTGLDRINSIDVDNLSIEPNIDKYATECQDIVVYGNTTDDVLLNCHSKGLDLKEIFVENSSDRIIDLDVSLGGKRKKYAIPVDSQ